MVGGAVSHVVFRIAVVNTTDEERMRIPVFDSFTHRKTVTLRGRILLIQLRAAAAGPLSTLETPKILHLRPFLFLLEKK